MWNLLFPLDIFFASGSLQNPLQIEESDFLYIWRENSYRMFFSSIFRGWKCGGARCCHGWRSFWRYGGNRIWRVLYRTDKQIFARRWGHITPLPYHSVSCFRRYDATTSSSLCQSRSASGHPKRVSRTVSTVCLFIVRKIRSNKFPFFIYILDWVLCTSKLITHWNYQAKSTYEKWKIRFSRIFFRF